MIMGRTTATSIAHPAFPRECLRPCVVDGEGLDVGVCHDHQNITSLGGAISHCTSATFGTRIGEKPLWINAVISPPVVRGYRCGVYVYPAWWSSGWQNSG